MHTFALEEIDTIKGRIKVFKLLVDGISGYDEFEKEINYEGNLASELRTIVTRLHEMADCKSLPATKFKDITKKNDPNKEYEIKTHNLRLYLFHDKNQGRVIVLGGKKSNQKTDIPHFRKMKNEYFKQKP